MVQFAIGTPGTLLGGPRWRSGSRPPTTTTTWSGSTTDRGQHPLRGRAGGQVYLLTPGATVADGTRVDRDAIGTPDATPDGAAASTSTPFPTRSGSTTWRIRTSASTPTPARRSPRTRISPSTSWTRMRGTTRRSARPRTRTFDGATQTTLYDIEAGNNALVRQGGVDAPGYASPNGGVLFTAAPAGR